MKTSIATLRYVRFAGFAIGAVAVAGAAVLITASASGYTLGFRPTAASQPNSGVSATSVDQAASSNAVCTDFISHLAGNLGKSQSQINAAIQKAISQTIADQVKAGKLTQTQADAITKRLAGKQVCSLPGGLGRTPGGTPPIRTGKYMTQLETAAAAALGITPAELTTDLKNGMSLSQIAAAHNITEATFRANLITQLKPQLDAAVTAKKLTQAQEDKILAALQTGPIPFWNAAPRKPAGAAPVTPAPTPA